MQCLLASQNKGKLREFRLALAGLGIELVSPRGWPDLQAPAETGATFAENARLKAAYYHAHTGLPAIADDSGLLVDALGGAPGVHSARYAATDSLRIARLLEELDKTGASRPWKARFVCSLFAIFSEDARIQATGRVEGEILAKPRGTGGFGYDPVFYYPPMRRTFAELDTTEKNRISHRARALEKLKVLLGKQGIATGFEPSSP